VTLVSALVVLGLLVATFGFVLAVLRRVPADREVNVSVRLSLWQIEVKIRQPPE
jgi:O-antigen/teichoic acid export membrane protein